MPTAYNEKVVSLNGVSTKSQILDLFPFAGGLLTAAEHRWNTESQASRRRRQRFFERTRHDYKNGRRQRFGKVDKGPKLTLLRRFQHILVFRLSYSVNLTIMLSKFEDEIMNFVPKVRIFSDRLPLSVFGALRWYMLASNAVSFSRSDHYGCSKVTFFQISLAVPWNIWWVNLPP